VFIVRHRVTSPEKRRPQRKIKCLKTKVAGYRSPDNCLRFLCLSTVNLNKTSKKQTDEGFIFDYTWPQYVSSIALIVEYYIWTPVVTTAREVYSRAKLMSKSWIHRPRSTRHPLNAAQVAFYRADLVYSPKMPFNNAFTFTDMSRRVVVKINIQQKYREQLKQLYSANVVF
jgi:hypothetical protein